MHDVVPRSCEGAIEPSGYINLAKYFYIFSCHNNEKKNLELIHKKDTIVRCKLEKVGKTNK